LWNEDADDLEERLDQALQCFQSADYLSAEKIIHKIFLEEKLSERLDASLLSKAYWLRAQLLIQNRNFKQAAEDYRQSLKIEEKISGKQSLDFLSMLRELGVLHFHWTGNYLLSRQILEEAESLCLELIQKNQNEALLIFETYSDVACTLGDLYDDLADHEKANRQFLSQAVYFKKMGTKMESFLLRPYLRIAQILAQKKMKSEMESCLNEAFALLDASKTTLLFFEALCVSADCYRKCHEMKEAEMSLQTAEQLLARDEDLMDSDVYIEFLRVQSLFHLRKQNSVLAEKSFILAVEKVRSIMGEKSLTEAMFYFEWAECLKDQHSQYHAEVENAYWQALDIIEKGFSENHPKQLRILKPYIEYLRKHKKFLQALALEERSNFLQSVAHGVQ